MMRPFPISEPELIRRRVLFALALTDPITGRLVSSGLRASVDELAGRPIINRSGHFVWLAEGDLRPTTVTITADSVPYEPDEVPLMALPAPPPLDSTAPNVPIADSERRQVIFLRPTAAYPFPDGATVVRGRLQETAAPNAPAINDAQVAIEWLAEPDQLPEAPHWNASVAVAVTRVRGEFAAALALPPGARPSVPAGKTIALRLRFDRGGVVRVTKQIVLPPAADDAITVQRNTMFLGKPIAWNELQAP